MPAFVALILLAGSVSAADAPSWIRVSNSMLAGELTPSDSADSGLPRNYFDELEPAQEMKFGAAYLGANTTTVFQTKGNISRSFDFPGDEIVRVMSGTITLIDEPSGHVQTFYPRDYFVVPRHWRGLWIFHSFGPEPAREFVTLVGHEWGPERAPLDRSTLSAVGKIPGAIAVDLQRAEARLAQIEFLAPNATAGAAGRSKLLGYTIFAGNPSLLMLKSPKGSVLERPSTQCESTVRVVSGTLTLEGPRGKSETFKPEDFVVITQNHHGKVRLSPNFAGLSSIVSGQDALGSPNTGPSVNHCPAL